MKLSPETVRGSRHGNRREIPGEILLFLLLFLFPQETKFKSAQNFSLQSLLPLFTRRCAAANAQSHGVFNLQTFAIAKLVAGWGP